MKAQYRNHNRRKQTGSSLIEAAAALSLFLPITLMLMYVMAESCLGAIIINGLNQGAREGARGLANMAAQYSYGQGNSEPPSIDLVQEVLSKVYVPGVVNNVNQFQNGYSVKWPSADEVAAAVQTQNTQPLLVTVTCHAAPGQIGGGQTAYNTPAVNNISIPWATLRLGNVVFDINSLLLQASSTYPIRPI